MISVADLKKWVNTLDEEGHVAIDDDGLSLVEITSKYTATAYVEVGGVPQEIANV